MKKRMRMTALFMVVVMSCLVVLGNIAPQPAIAASVDGYVSLDSTDPIEFGGSYIEYQGKRVTLGPKAIYLDGSLSDAVADSYEYVYNDVKEALSAAALTDGTEGDPMVVYIAPYVYWIDDPDATDTVGKTPGYGSPYGMVVNCQWLQLTGLTANPYNVILAGNRGQSHGADGNYTMFRFNGDGLNVNNLTIGNYCSIDLVYNLKPALNHAKRTSTITQAQLADMSGDKMFADNCNFVSRLNLDPINGAKRSLYNDCHFESTDDAINGNAVFVGCDFDFYGNRPLYSSYNTGSTFLGCTFNCKVLNVEAEPMQYFTKEGGPITAVDCVFNSSFDIPFGIAWTKYPAASLRCYQYNIKHNGTPITIAGDTAAETVDMTGKSVLDAYRVESGGQVYYNTYNLLKGNDGWDPLNVKDIVTAAGKDNISTILSLSIDDRKNTIESGVDTANVSSSVKYFHGAEEAAAAVTYSVSQEDSAYVKVTDHKDGTCTVEGINDADEAKKVTIYASTEGGLEGAVELTVKPSILAAPAFTSTPAVSNGNDGSLKVDYSLDLGSRADQSLISWYRCTDAAGSNPVLVAVTRKDDPAYTYEMTAGDIGYYMMAKVEPKHIRSNPGEGVTAVYPEAVTVKDIKAKNLSTDFSRFPVISQPEIKAGFWTVDSYRPLDTESFSKWQGDPDAQPWVYGETGNGCVGTGIYQGTQGSRLMYTPVAGEYGDMSLKLVVDPAKTAGQGFGSAGQYMDVCLKFDTATLSGYGLRIIRTTAASNAVTFVLVKYENGQTRYISEEIIASCFATGCEITLKAEGTKLTAHVETPTPQLADQAASGWVHSVDLNADITATTFGGVAIQHTGTTGSGGWQNTTMLHNLDVVWEGENNQNPVYVEDPVVDPTPDPSNPEDPAPAPGVGGGDGVQTGDAANMGFWAILAMLSAAGAAGLGVYARRRQVRR